MAIEVTIPTPLRQFAGGEDTVHVPGKTVDELLTNLIATYSGMGDLLYDGGKLRRSLLVCVNGEDMRFLDSELTPLKEGDNVSILPAFAGG